MFFSLAVNASQVSESLRISNLFTVFKDIHLIWMQFRFKNWVLAAFMTPTRSLFAAITVDPYTVYTKFKYIETH
jgi:hypothetical protein